MPTLPDVNLWPDAEHALDYLGRADSIPHRVEGEAALLKLPRPAPFWSDTRMGARHFSFRRIGEHSTRRFMS